MDKKKKKYETLPSELFFWELNFQLKADVMSGPEKCQMNKKYDMYS